MRLPTLQRGRLIQRYKRFLADIELDSGDLITAHCPNTGAMTGLTMPGAQVWVSHSDNPKRKLAWTWELVETAAGLVWIHSAKANEIVREALESEVISVGGYNTLTPEVRYGAGSRVDFELCGGEHRRTLLEVKAVTLMRQSGLGEFPDAISARALKHVNELMASVGSGDRAILLFCSLHGGVERFRPAIDVDAAYAARLLEAVDGGVEIMALGVDVTPTDVCASRFLPVELPASL